MNISLTEEELYFLIEWAKFGVFATHEDHRSRVVEKWGNIVNRLYKEGIKIYGWQFDDEGKDSFNILFAKEKPEKQQ